jgi:hypothetical protein
VWQNYDHFVKSTGIWIQLETPNFWAF